MTPGKYVHYSNSAKSNQRLVKMAPGQNGPWSKWPLFKIVPIQNDTVKHLFPWLKEGQVLPYEGELLWHYPGIQYISNSAYLD